MNFGNLFAKSITREIRRNVGKGISNDLFGDWHATPVRNVKNKSQKEGWDIDHVSPEEYDVSEQPEWVPESGYFGSVFLNFLTSLFVFPILILPFFTIRDFTRKTMNLYAKVPMRRTDGRTKTGYRELNEYAYVKLKSKRLLTRKEIRNSKIAGLCELFGILLAVGFLFYLRNKFIGIVNA